MVMPEQESPPAARPQSPHMIGRRALLQAAGAGAGIAAVNVLHATPAHAGAEHGPAAAARHPGFAASAGSPLIGGTEYPIGLFWPPPPFQTTLQRYQEIADAGFTFIHSNNYLWADTSIQSYALGMADQAGLQVLVDDATIRWMVQEFNVTTAGGAFTLTPAEATTKIQQLLNTYQLRSFWKIQNDQLLAAGGSDPGFGLSQQGATWTDYTFSFDMAPQPGGAFAQAGWVFRAKDSLNGYAWLLSNFAYTTPAARGYLVKVLYVNGDPPVYVKPVPLNFAVTAGSWYHVTTTVSGGTITTSINGTVVDTTTDTTYASGRVGFRTAGSDAALFDNVKVTDPRGKVLLADDFSSGLGQWQPQNAGGHASFAGFDIYDEPSDSKSETLANVVAIVRSLAPDALPYINLLPDFDAGAGYASFAAKVKPSQLSFDRYPILASGEDTGYFNNWAEVRAAALQAGLPAWVYIQSVGYAGHAVPTAKDLLWQINISLAYGCKGIQYFTYWTPDPARGEGFSDALITVDGQRTPLYEAAKTINKRYLAPVGAALLPLTSDSVQAANLPSPPQGLPAFTGDGYVAGTSGGAAVLGRFRSSQGTDRTRWLLAANFSRHQATSVRLTPGPLVAGVDSFDPASGEYKEMGTGSVTLTLGAGAGQLLRLRAS
jgi:hypothetical protein